MALIMLAASLRQGEVEMEWLAGRLRDGTGCIHNSVQFLMVLGRHVDNPSCDVSSYDAFHGASMEMSKNHWRHAELPYS